MHADQVVWEGVLKKKVNPRSEIEIDFPQPPQPFKTSFQLDELNPGDWEQFDAGDKVRFIGRFDFFGAGTPEIVVHIRFPAEQAVALPGEAEVRAMAESLIEAVRRSFGGREEE